MFFDPVYFIFMLPAIALTMWAQWRVHSAFHQGKAVAARSGLSGAEVARQILSAHNLNNVGVELTNRQMGDHYDPRSKTLRLSEDVYHGRSLTALGVAAHEAGHAIQDKERYGPLVIRNGIVPLASVGGQLSMGLIFLGFFIGLSGMILLGILMFSAVVIFQLINLPVEFNASSRAREVLLRHGIVSDQEDRTVAKVLNAAAMTYVAATLTAVLTLLYYISVLNRRD